MSATQIQTTGETFVAIRGSCQFAFEVFQKLGCPWDEFLDQMRQGGHRADYITLVALATVYRRLLTRGLSIWGGRVKDAEEDAEAWNLNGC